ncbi:MAG: site-specific DNA-methyltransferase, partial [Anaerolineales bacterium]|nr:site-specific DNA-methyltransferase [Anaerolineales bacterium]
MILNQVKLSDVTEGKQDTDLPVIDRLDKQLFQRFKSRFVIQPALSRSLVSFQANKTRPVYRWYKFKEAFSASLVEQLFHKYGITAGRILDPFAGSGTALFAASVMGIDADGIELLPIGHEIIRVKQVLDAEFTTEDFERLRYWSEQRVWENAENRALLQELRITRGAYPTRTKESIEKYLVACQQENSRVQTVLRFALLCTLESISFTRKDGQYLRWDDRSKINLPGKPFDIGKIYS